MHAGGPVGTGGGPTTDQGSTDVLAGWFRWNTARDEWDWSDEVFLIHGYEPATVQPSSELVLRHKVGGHRDQAGDVMRRVAAVPGRFSHYHRLLDAHGRVRVVLVVGDSRGNGDRELVAEGWMADVTALERAAADEAVLASSRSRARINHAQGALMAVHGLSEAAAHSLLVWHSQQYNVKLSRLAEGVVERLAGGPVTDPSVLDRLLVEVAEALAQGRASGPPPADPGAGAPPRR